MGTDTLLTISDYAFSAAERVPDRIALIDENSRISYSELADRIRLCVCHLIELGVERGDRVAVMSPPTCDAYILLLALNVIGSIWLGINPRYTKREISYVVNDAQPTIFVADNNIEDSISAWLYSPEFCTDCVGRVYLLQDFFSQMAAPDILGGEASTLQVAAGPDDIAALVYTSGSSGAPKGCMLPNRSVIGRNLIFNRRFPVTDYPRLCSVMPMNHIAGTTTIPSATLMAEGTVIFRQKFNPDEVGKLIETYSLNIYFAAPAMFQLIFRSPGFNREQFQSLEWLIYGGASMSLDSVVVLKALCDRVVSSWGMTETLGPTTFTEINATAEEISGSIGKAAREDEVKVMREDGVQCSVGETGEIFVRREYCMAGYFNRPKDTDNAFTSDGWLKTGDLAQVLEDGSLRFAGRISDMFKSGGYNIYPREIEMVLERHPAVALAAVIGVEDEIWGEVGRAFVLPRHGMKVTAAELKKWCKERMANYKVPKAFEITDDLPLLPLGKVDKVALRRVALKSPGTT